MPSLRHRILERRVRRAYLPALQGLEFLAKRHSCRSWRVSPPLIRIGRRFRVPRTVPGTRLGCVSTLFPPQPTDKVTRSARVPAYATSSDVCRRSRLHVEPHRRRPQPLCRESHWTNRAAALAKVAGPCRGMSDSVTALDQTGSNLSARTPLSRFKVDTKPPLTGLSFRLHRLCIDHARHRHPESGRQLAAVDMILGEPRRR